jgi:hypothetical protein
MTSQTLRRIEKLETEMLPPKDAQKVRITVRFVESVDGVLVPAGETQVFEVTRGHLRTWRSRTS